MSRRVQYHFGTSLDTKADGTEFSSVGIALTSSIGEVTLIAPTKNLPEGQGIITRWDVDGITIDFKDISSAEAPSATIMYLPGYKAIFNSELMYRGMHNIYTLRGAQVRDALGWSKLINDIIQEWGNEVELMIGPHGPSFSGNGKINEYMTLQRDNYGFVHNQALRLINSGMKIQDVGQAIEEMVPESLSKVWHTHGYHGTYSHNARGVVNRYIGFYDGNPANLNPLQIKPEALKYVEYMGGADNILAKAQADFANGDYRFVATVLNKLVTVEPNNWPARHLLADAHEQLGYQAEGPQWRNAYLTAAKELRTGSIFKPESRSNNVDMLQAATIGNLLDSVAVRINASEAEGKEFTLNLTIPDTNEKYLVELSNSNLSNIRVEELGDADTSLTINKGDLLKMMSGKLGVMDMISLGAASIEGSPFTLVTLVGLIEKDEQYYDMVPMPEA
jgi:alkyl sulfatase BDS1-like metallo-beta-lactamase superfamily hydrolase